MKTLAFRVYETKGGKSLSRLLLSKQPMKEILDGAKKAYPTGKWVWFYDLHRWEYLK